MARTPMAPRASRTARAATPKPKPAAPPAEAPVAAAGPPAPAHGEIHALLQAHGAKLAELRPADGGAVRVRCHAPHSVERFVAAARAHPQVREVRVLPAHIELDVAVPAALAAED